MEAFEADLWIEKQRIYKILLKGYFTPKKRYSYAGIQPMYLYVTVYLSNIHKKKVNRKKVERSFWGSLTKKKLKDTHLCLLWTA